MCASPPDLSWGYRPPDAAEVLRRHRPNQLQVKEYRQIGPSVKSLVAASFKIGSMHHHIQVLGARLFGLRSVRFNSAQLCRILLRLCHNVRRFLVLSTSGLFSVRKFPILHKITLVIITYIFVALSVLIAMNICRVRPLQPHFIPSVPTPRLLSMDQLFRAGMSYPVALGWVLTRQAEWQFCEQEHLTFFPCGDRGLTRKPRFRTNILEPHGHGHLSSRGKLTASFLVPATKGQSFDEYVSSLTHADPSSVHHPGFNLLIAELKAEGEELTSTFLTNHGSGGEIKSRSLRDDERACGGISNGVDGQTMHEWTRISDGLALLEPLMHEYGCDREDDLVEKLMELLRYITVLLSNDLANYAAVKLTQSHPRVSMM